MAPLEHLSKITACQREEELGQGDIPHGCRKRGKRGLAQFSVRFRANRGTRQCRKLRKCLDITCRERRRNFDTLCRSRNLNSGRKEEVVKGCARRCGGQGIYNMRNGGKGGGIDVTLGK